MNASNPNAGPALFSSVRTSRDLTLVAFAGALLVAFALHAGAFVPPLSAPANDQAAAIEASRPAAPAVVARRPATVARGVGSTPAVPRTAPRG